MKVVLGVSGGIAAYKAAEIVRLLQDRGVSVQVVMTRAAQEFVRPLTFAALTGEKVITDMFAGNDSDANLDSAVEHIAVAQSADMLLVAPATANVIAKFAQGLADDFLTTLYLATTAPVVLAPAMNVNMWGHPATKANLEMLKQRGVQIVDPDSGYLACGMTGAGRLAEPSDIVEAAMAVLGPQDFAGETVIVTAGPTREPIDPVRYISNRSSGKMGHALAEAALRRGATVILITGPTSLTAPAGVQIVWVETAAEMQDALLSRIDQASVVIKAAAVSDYTVANPSEEKIKRATGPLRLELEPTTDIIAEAARRKPANQIIVGFAAETTSVLENARRKLTTKGVDAVVVNDVSRPGIGFDSERNAVTIITPEEEIEVQESTKSEVAHQILNAVHRIRERQTEPMQPTRR